jgi:nucleoside phosphorylase
MPLELTAAVGMLEEHTIFSVPEDDALYRIGRIGGHYVVIAVCPRIGTHPAATLLANMRRSFPNIQHVLVVGIAGAVPCYGVDLEQQITLGDVVVGIPQWGKGGVVHYEFGAWEGKNRLTVSEHTLHPSDALLTAVNNVRSDHEMLEGSKMPQYLRELRGLLNARARPKFEDPGDEHDFLFDRSVPGSAEELFSLLSPRRREDRGTEAVREPDCPRIHYGTIGSANTLVISSAKRDELYKEHGVICFEMESAGVMSGYQALVIRGICDYADANKNKRWQNYAAATAAAYAKEVLLRVPVGGRFESKSSATDTRRGEPRQNMFHSHGAGPMNVHTGTGSQSNNNGSGNLFQGIGPGA